MEPEPGKGEATQGRLLERHGRGELDPGPLAPPAPPAARSSRAARAGRHDVPLPTGRVGLAYVPPTLALPTPAHAAVLLHGAGADAEAGLRLLQPWADAERIVLLAPRSAGSTWDLMGDGLGPDVAAVEVMLAWAADRVPLDRARLAIAGFSDGASYALALGLANGALFSDVFAFSPGFAAAPRRQGRPRLFVSHGAQDDVLPVERCGRLVVLRLARLGYDVMYEEFEGGHTLPARLAAKAVRRWLRPRVGRQERR